MNNKIRQVCRNFVRVCVYLFAFVGIVATAYSGYWYRQRPANFAAPNSFLILDIYRVNDREGPRTRIYLDSATSPSDLSFEGPKLTHELEGALHPQATVPLAGIAVGGSGKVVFGEAKISVDDGRIDINGDPVCPSEVTVTRFGTFRNGLIKIAR